ncbi:hypothetical protein D037_1111A, partial [Vibrio parahaemolyticus IDH02640]
MKFFELTGAR